MNKKTLLVLAASTYQLECIEKAKQLNYRVITTDNIASNPGHQLADKSYLVDTTNKIEILKLAIKENIDGIIAPCTDVALPTAAYVASQLNLPGIAGDFINTLTNKVLFRHFLAEKNLNHPSYYILNDNLQIDDIDFNQRWILKPDCSSGSKGIFIISSKIEYFNRINDTLEYCRESAILEQYVDGFQGTCEGIVNNGKIEYMAVLDRQTASSPYVTTIGHHLPSSISDCIQKQLVHQIEYIWRILKTTETVFDCDFVISGENIFIIELTPRLGGNSITKLLKKSQNVDLAKYAIQLACGEKPDLLDIAELKPMAIRILGVWKKGNITYNKDEYHKLQKETWVDELFIEVKPGDRVLPFINSRNRIGEVLIHGIDRNDLEFNVKQFFQRLSMDVMT